MKAASEWLHTEIGLKRKEQIILSLGFWRHPEMWSKQKSQVKYWSADVPTGSRDAPKPKCQTLLNTVHSTPVLTPCLALCPETEPRSAKVLPLAVTSSWSLPAPQNEQGVSVALVIGLTTCWPDLINSLPLKLSIQP